MQVQLLLLSGATRPLHGNLIPPLHLAGTRPPASLRHKHVNIAPQNPPPAPRTRSVILRRHSPTSTANGPLDPSRQIYVRLLHGTFKDSLRSLASTTGVISTLAFDITYPPDQKLCAFSSGKRNLIVEPNILLSAYPSPQLPRRATNWTTHTP